MAELRIGTCSWKYPSWHGLVYSAPKGVNYLAEYAERYDTVEVDQWFWSLFGADNVKLPNAFDVKRYRASVPEGFRFAVKVPNSVTLTHLYKKAKADPLVPNPYFLSAQMFERFLSLLDPLRDLLGPLMFQFEYLNRQKMGSQAQFQERLGMFTEALPPGYLYAVETRNGNYLNAAFLEFLAQHKLIPVLLQGYWIPPVVDVYRQWGPLIRQHEVAVIRLLGPDRKGIEDLSDRRWDRIVAARDEELAGVTDLVDDLMDKGVNVYLLVNNHYEGSAPLTIDRIRELLRR